MSMTQLVIGTALGFMVAQGVLYPIKRLAGWLQRDEVRRQIRSVAHAPGPATVGESAQLAAAVINGLHGLASGGGIILLDSLEDMLQVFDGES